MSFYILLVVPFLRWLWLKRTKNAFDVACTEKHHTGIYVRYADVPISIQPLHCYRPYNILKFQRSVYTRFVGCCGMLLLLLLLLQLLMLLLLFEYSTQFKLFVLTFFALFSAAYLLEIIVTILIVIYMSNFIESRKWINIWMKLTTWKKQNTWNILQSNNGMHCISKFVSIAIFKTVWFLYEFGWNLYVVESLPFNRETLRNRKAAGKIQTIMYIPPFIQSDSFWVCNTNSRQHT